MDAAAVRADRIVISPWRDPQATGPGELVKAGRICSELWLGWESFGRQDCSEEIHVTLASHAWNHFGRANVGAWDAQWQSFGMGGVRKVHWMAAPQALPTRSSDWGQGAVCQDCWSCSFLLCPPLCLPYGKRRKLQLRISVGERCAFQLRLRQHEMMPVPKKDVVVGKDSLGAVKPPNDAAPSSSHGLLGKPGI